MKKILACILAVIMLVAGLCSTILSSSYEPGTEEAEFQAQLLALSGISTGGTMVEIAEQEFQRQEGRACGADYWEHFGNGPEDWCVDFLYYCADQLGLVGKDKPFGPPTSGCGRAWDQLIAGGAEAFTIFDGVPQAGDIVFYFDTDGGAATTLTGWSLCHVGIVINYDSGILRTIEGNAGTTGFRTTTVRKCVYFDPKGQAWEGAAIAGFLRPQYPSASLIAGNLTDLVTSFEGFQAYPYWDYSQWSVGYGTRCPDGKLSEYKLHGIPQEDAQKLLAQHLYADGAYVDAWARRSGLELQSCQRDALISLTYNIGPGWMDSEEYASFRYQILKGGQGLSFIQAWAQICHAGGQVLPALADRRICEANLYLSGRYATSPEATGYTYTISGDNVVVKLRIKEEVKKP